MSVAYIFKNVHDSAGKPRAEFEKLTGNNLSGPLRGFLAQVGLGKVFAQSSPMYACEDLCQEYKDALDPVNARQFEIALKQIKLWQETHPLLAASTPLEQPEYTTESAAPHAHAA